MARTLAEQLDALDELIATLEAAGGTAEYSHGAERQRFAELHKLYERRDMLEQRIARDSGGTFSLLDPFQS